MKGRHSISFRIRRMQPACRPVLSVVRNVRVRSIAALRAMPFLLAALSLIAQAALPVLAQSNPDGIQSSESLYYSDPELIDDSTTRLKLDRPPLSALVTLDRELDPFQLDAETARPVRLSDVVTIAIERNLDIGISDYDTKISRARLFNACGNFLPNAQLGFNWNYIDGRIRLPFNVGAQDVIRIRDPFIIARAGVNYFAYRGGQTVFTMLRERNNLRASRHKLKTTVNDTLLEATRLYYDLVLNYALLKIRIRAVDTSKEQLQQNQDLEQNGMATRLDVLQARTQLDEDEQRLIDQQVARRRAAIRLAKWLDLDQGVDLVPEDGYIRTVRLLSKGTRPGQLLAMAVSNRPELKELEQRRLADRKEIVVAQAPLHPTVQLSATEFGIGQTLGDEKETVVVNTPITLNGTTRQVPIARQISRQITGLGVLGVNVQWNLTGFGTADLANVRAAKLTARQSLLRLNRRHNEVIDEVRGSFLNSLGAEAKLEVTTSRVRSSAEELRLARLRLQTGLGKNIDVLRAQQDYTSALVEHAQACIEFNMAQAQLLRDTGTISRQTLVGGGMPIVPM